VLDPQLHALFEARECLNYFFAFRWLLIHFKREFPFDQVRRCWRCLLCCVPACFPAHLSVDIHICACAVPVQMLMRVHCLRTSAAPCSTPLRPNPSYSIAHYLLSQLLYL
jgi:hypothetical protein